MFSWYYFSLWLFFLVFWVHRVVKTGLRLFHLQLSLCHTIRANDSHFSKWGMRILARTCEGGSQQCVYVWQLIEYLQLIKESKVHMDLEKIALERSAIKVSPLSREAVGVLALPCQFSERGFPGEHLERGAQRTRGQLRLASSSDGRVKRWCCVGDGGSPRALGQWCLSASHGTYVVCTEKGGTGFP